MKVKLTIINTDFDHMDTALIEGDELFKDTSSLHRLLGEILITTQNINSIEIRTEDDQVIRRIKSNIVDFDLWEQLRGNTEE